MKRRTIFLDRDGVLNANIVRDGKPYAPRKLEDFHLLPGVKLALDHIKNAGFLAIVATNQPDVAAGLMPRATVEAMHIQLRNLLPLDDIAVCWHRDADQCACRKPKPGLLLAAAAKWDIDLPKSYMIGDRWRDIDAGRAAGCTTVLIDHGLVQERNTSPDLTASSLDEAITLIFSREQEKFARQR
ncbi:MAG TPA: HAD family hydrolase [Stellaceae bacterium]|nr:HAD family hydrolase [Stellaceae bacterium]